jgi:8-oxo-dGTP pyrophosphatase MutT (NUDIX family)
LSARLDDRFAEDIRRRMRAFVPEQADPGRLIGAAVALLLLPNRNGAPCFLLTRRAEGLRRHSGQWAIPGGRRDPGESPEQAARRELEEELGIDASSLESMGRLDDYVTRSGYVIVPVVFLHRSPLRLRPNPDEVAAAYRIPLAALQRPSALLIERHQDGAVTLRYRILGRLINPPTAAILHQLSELVVHGRHTAVGGFLQPEFTWR